AACLGRLLSSIEQYGSIGDCPQDAARRFEALATGGRGAKPLIGIVGEIYVRSNQFSNNFFIRQIEALGGEVVVPTLQEWVAYTDTERRKDQRRSGTFKSYLAERLKKQVQDHYVRKISRPFQGQVKHFFRELETDDVMRLCRPYCVEHIRGEANLSMGRAVEYARHGMHGVANLIPFNCMPGTIVNTLLWRFAGDYPQLPLLKMVYDGTEQAGDRTRIEAFMYQARQALEAGRK
ncbi:MAG: hypothetical protein GY868_15480, partial [Deltaproteobacteria bacterium]|nr:hypothetical protein [Deltaproteobacteria bacterium]